MTEAESNSARYRAALVLAAAAIGGRLPQVRIGLLDAAPGADLQVRALLGFPAEREREAAGMALGTDFVSGGAIRPAPAPLRRVLGLRDAILLPLTRNGAATAALLIDAPKLDAAAVGFACSISDALAALLEMTPSGSAPQTDTNLSRTLLHLSTRVAAFQSLREMLGEITRTVVRFVDCNRSSVLLWSQRRKAFVPAADVGTPLDLAARFAANQYEFGNNVIFEKDLRDGRTVVFDRNTPDAAGRKLLEVLQLETMCIVPLAYRGKALGAMTASWEAPHSVTHRELTMLNSFAHHAAVAIGTARLLDDATQAAKFRDALSQLSLTVHTVEQPDEVLRIIVQRLRSLFRTQWAGILRHEGRKLVVSEAAGPNATALLGTTIEIDDSSSLIARVYREGRPILSHDAVSSRDFPSAFPVASLVASPLLARQIAFGVLVLADPKPYRFNARVVEEAGMATVIAASALENASLLDKLRANTAALAQRTAWLEEYARALERKTRELENGAIQR